MSTLDMDRFNVTTGTVPSEFISGVLFGDGVCVYRKAIAGPGGDGPDFIWSSSFEGSKEDIEYKYKGQAGYKWTDVDAEPDPVKPLTSGK